jgi:regulator of sirC expression with transglutaminase-like and TPR domain
MALTFNSISKPWDDTVPISNVSQPKLSLGPEIEEVINKLVMKELIKNSKLITYYSSLNKCDNEILSDRLSIHLSLGLGSLYTEDQISEYIKSRI